MNIRETQRAVQQELAQHHDTIIQFLRDLVAIPSYDSQVGPVGDAVGARIPSMPFTAEKVYQALKTAGGASCRIDF